MVDSVVSAAFAKDSVGSMTVGIVSGSDLVRTQSYGFANMDSRKPNGGIFTTIDDLSRFLSFELVRGPDSGCYWPPRARYAEGANLRQACREEGRSGKNSLAVPSDADEKIMSNHPTDTCPMTRCARAKARFAKRS